MKNLGWVLALVLVVSKSLFPMNGDNLLFWNNIQQLCLSVDGKKIACKIGEEIVIANLENDEIIKSQNIKELSPNIEYDGFNKFQFNRDGILDIVFRNHRIIYDGDKNIFNIKKKKSEIDYVYMSPNRVYGIFCTQYYTKELFTHDWRYRTEWDFLGDKELQLFIRRKCFGGIKDVSWAADSKKFSLMKKSLLQVFSVKNKLERTYRASKESVFLAAKWVPKANNILAIQVYDAKKNKVVVKFWNYRNKKVIDSLELENKKTTPMELTADGKWLVYGCQSANKTFDCSSSSVKFLDYRKKIFDNLAKREGFSQGVQRSLGLQQLLSDYIAHDGELGGTEKNRS